MAEHLLAAEKGSKNDYDVAIYRTMRDVLGCRGGSKLDESTQKEGHLGGGREKGKAKEKEAGLTAKNQSRFWSRATTLVSRVRCPSEGAVFLSKIPPSNQDLIKAVANLLKTKFSKWDDTASKEPKDITGRKTFSWIPIFQWYDGQGQGPSDTKVLSHLSLCWRPRIKDVFLEGVLSIFLELDTFASDYRLEPWDADVSLPDDCEDEVPLHFARRVSCLICFPNGA